MTARSWSKSAGSNTSVLGINIGEGMARSDVNNALRSIMAETKNIIDGVPVTPLEYGAVGDGVTLDTDAIDLAMATGKRVVFPAGYTFLTDTKFGHRFSVDGQVVEINGTILHNGTLHTIGAGYTGYFGLFSAFEVSDIQLIGSGTLDGAWNSNKASVVGRVGSGLTLSNCPRATIVGPLFQNFYDDAIKTFSCPDINVLQPTRFFNIRNIGLELRSYATNPYAAIGSFAGFLGTAWSGTIKGPSGTVNISAEQIDDGLHGAGNGSAIDFSASGTTPPPCNNLRISANIKDCLLGIWSENNVPGSEAYNITIDGVVIEGDIAGAGTTECSDGIGFVGVLGGTIRNVLIRNQTNIAPPNPGAETAGVNIVQCTDIHVEGVRVETDTGIANRMQHAIKLSGSDRVEIKGCSQSGVTGISTMSVTSSPILYDTTVGAECTDIRVEGFAGANDEETWGNLVKLTYSAQNVPISATTTLLPVGATGMDGAPLPCAGRVVCMTVRGGAGQVFTGTYTFKVLAGGVEQTALNLTQAGIATVSGASQGRTKQAARAATQYAAETLVAATLTTNGSWTATHDVYVDVWVDAGLKK